MEKRLGLVLLLCCMACGGSSVSNTSTSSGTSSGTSSTSGWSVVTSSGDVVDNTSFIGTDQSNQLATGGVTKGETAGDFDIVILASDTTNGWAVGNLGEVLKSTDSGKTSTRIAFASSGTLRAVMPMSTKSVWIAGGDTVNSGSSIWATTDGGTTWASQFNTVTGYSDQRTLTVMDHINSLAFFSATTALAAGGLGDNTSIILQTADGSKWTSVYRSATTGTNDQLHDVAYGDANTAFAVGNGGVILASTDGGATWKTQTSGTTQNLFKVRCSSATVCYVVGGSGLVLKTTNGGTTWTALTSGTTKELAALAIIGGKIWAGGDSGTMIYSPDGGSTWTTQTSNTNYPVKAIWMVDENTGWAACANTSSNTGALLDTATGGK